ncbi:MAG: DMT family transporter, partial [Rikenellaceae bacterium]
MRYKGWLALAAANSLFGMNFVLFSSLTENYMSYELLFLIVVGVNAIFFAPAIFKKASMRFTFKEFSILALTSMVIVYGKEYYMIKGASHTIAADSSTIATLAPVVTLSLSALLHREKLHMAKIIGVLLAFIGSAVLLYDNFRNPAESSYLLGNLMILVSVFAGASNTVFIRPVITNYPSYFVMGWTYIIGVLITYPFFAPFADWSQLLHMPQQGWYELITLSVLGTALPTFFLYYGVKQLTSVHTAIFSYFQPVAAVALGWMIGRNIHFD